MLRIKKIPTMHGPLLISRRPHRPGTMGQDDYSDDSSGVAESYTAITGLPADDGVTSSSPSPGSTVATVDTSNMLSGAGSVLAMLAPGIIGASAPSLLKLVGLGPKTAAATTVINAAPATSTLSRYLLPIGIGAAVLVAIVMMRKK